MRKIDHRAEGQPEDQNPEAPDMGLDAGMGPEGTGLEGVV